MGGVGVFGGSEARLPLAGLARPAEQAPPPWVPPRPPWPCHGPCPLPAPCGALRVRWRGPRVLWARARTRTRPGGHGRDGSHPFRPTRSHHTPHIGPTGVPTPLVPPRRVCGLARLLPLIQPRPCACVCVCVGGWVRVCVWVHLGVRAVPRSVYGPARVQGRGRMCVATCVTSI